VCLGDAYLQGASSAGHTGPTGAASWRFDMGVFCLQVFVFPSGCAVADVPVRLYRHLSDRHTLLHVLYVAHLKFQLVSTEAGFNMGPCLIAEHIAQLMSDLS
jgi:hypothetical protein